MTHQYMTQIDFIWADHVPDCDGTILTAGHHHTIIKSETEIIRSWLELMQIVRVIRFESGAYDAVRIHCSLGHDQPK